MFDEIRIEMFDGRLIADVWLEIDRISLMGDWYEMVDAMLPCPIIFSKKALRRDWLKQGIRATHFRTHNIQSILNLVSFYVRRIIQHFNNVQHILPVVYIHCCGKYILKNVCPGTKWVYLNPQPSLLLCCFIYGYKALDMFIGVWGTVICAQ